MKYVLFIYNYIYIFWPVLYLMAHWEPTVDHLNMNKIWIWISIYVNFYTFLQHKCYKQMFYLQNVSIYEFLNYNLYENLGGGKNTWRMERYNNSSYTKKWRRRQVWQLQGNSIRKFSLQNFVKYNIGKN